jgi:phosphoribosylaminoimidazole-succinocarboxamide synthase
MTRKTTPIMETALPGMTLFRRGKVRDVYDLGDQLLIISTDRLSAFDSVLPTPIPDKGRVLTGLSRFWFGFLSDMVKNHLLSAEVSEMGHGLQRHKDVLDGRAMLTAKAEVFPIECVVRGYLTGSGWKEYKAKGTVCGIPLPRGLEDGSRLPEPIFTPATKAESGHDENISFEQTVAIIGNRAAERLKELSLAVYNKAVEHALAQGIIIADTKFEFGLVGGEITLVDEALTPDSSRFWPLDIWAPGKIQQSFDKQFVRDYLEGIGWNKEPPAPQLPDKVVDKTREKYLEAYRRLVGKELP